MEKQSKLTKHWVQALLSKPLLARLATANPITLQPHVVSVWFSWDGESIWISAFSSTRKVKDVVKNPRISVIIDTGDENPPPRAVLMEGKAELLTDPHTVQKWSSTIYSHYLGEDGVKAPEPQSWIVDPENTIIKLTPEKVFIWGQSD